MQEEKQQELKRDLARWKELQERVCACAGHQSMVGMCYQKPKQSFILHCPKENHIRIYA